MTQANAPAFNEHAELVLRDEHGRPFLVIGQDKVAVIGPNGEMAEQSREDAIMLVDGLLWTPQMLKWSNPVLVTTCAECRNPRRSLLRPERASHGLLSVRNARSCARCGRVLCPRHRRWEDGGWHCHDCAKTNRFKKAVRWLFFREEE